MGTGGFAVIHTMGTGEITVIQNREKCDVEWKIGHFLSLSETQFYCSPFFSFSGEKWCLLVCPGTEGFIELGILRGQFMNQPPLKVAFSFTLKTVTGQNVLKRHGTKDIEGSRVYTITKFLSLSDFEERRSEFLSSEILTVICSLKRVTTAGNTTTCCYCSKIFSVDEVSTHEKKCGVKCPECLDVLPLKNWPNHECQISRKEAVEKLFDDLKLMMVREDHSDITIKVKTVQFRLHRIILGTRNTYFNSMFNCDMREKNTGIVSIEECEPEIFCSFIHFIYTGQVDCLSLKNVCDLYKVSDMYQEDQLKKQCLQFMMQFLSVDNFCDFTTVALMYDEKELLKVAKKMFASKNKEITGTAKWLIFLKEHPEFENELHDCAYHENKILTKEESILDSIAIFLYYLFLITYILFFF